MEEDIPEIPTPPVQQETNSESKIHFAVSKNKLIIAALCFLSEILLGDFALERFINIS